MCFGVFLRAKTKFLIKAGSFLVYWTNSDTIKRHVARHCNDSLQCVYNQQRSKAVTLATANNRNILNINKWNAVAAVNFTILLVVKLNFIGRSER